MFKLKFYTETQFKTNMTACDLEQSLNSITKFKIVENTIFSSVGIS